MSGQEGRSVPIPLEFLRAMFDGDGPTPEHVEALKAMLPEDPPPFSDEEAREFYRALFPNAEVRGKAVDKMHADAGRTFMGRLWRAGYDPRARRTS